MSDRIERCRRYGQNCPESDGNGIHLFLGGCKVFDGPLCAECVEYIRKFVEHGHGPCPKPACPPPEPCGRPADADCPTEGCCREPKTHRGPDLVINDSQRAALLTLFGAFAAAAVSRKPGAA